MTVMSSRRCLTDRLTLVQIIRGIFARSPVFRDALISETRVGPEGAVIVDVSFDHKPAAFRVVAPSVEEAYAILHEVASSMVEIERNRNAGNGHGEDDYEAVPVDVARQSDGTEKEAESRLKRSANIEPSASRGGFVAKNGDGHRAPS